MPEKKFIAGSVSACLWKNAITDKNNGMSGYYTISLQRNYKDKNGNWQNSGSMRVNDLPKATLVLSRAYEYLVLKEKQENEEGIDSLY